MNIINKKKREPNEELLSTTQALALMEQMGLTPVTLPTLITWCEKYKFGSRFGGHWKIIRHKFEQYCNQILLEIER